MKILFFGVEPHSPHFETQLELMETHVAAGDDVTYISCDSALGYCDANPSNEKLFCVGCQGKRRNGLKLLSKSVEVLKLSSLMSEVASKFIQTKFSSVDKLINYKLSGYDCGEAVASSLFSYADTIYPSLSEYAGYIERAVTYSVNLYFSIDSFLKRNVVDVAYIYNGRGATSRCLVRACETNSVRFFTHERGSSVDSYALIENTVIHNVDYYNRAALTFWEASLDDNKDAIADEFFSRMRRGKLLYSEKNYLKKQIKGALPSMWTERSPRYAFFTSTESEMAGLRGFYDRKMYVSLLDALEKIVADLVMVDFQGVFLIRMHPNSLGEYASLKPRLDELLKSRFVVLVTPDQDIDTYSLVDSADKVLTTYSTVGIEAAYAGIPSITVERSFYDLLGSTYSPQSHDEVMQLLLNPIEAKPVLGAKIFAYYTMSFGQKFCYVTMQGQTKCSFKGRKIRSPRWVDWLMSARKKIRKLIKSEGSPA